jgi:hypothetical protein
MAYFFGRRVSIEIQRYLTKYMIAMFIITVAFQIGFKVYFSNKALKDMLPVKPLLMLGFLDGNKICNASCDCDK